MKTNFILLFYMKKQKNYVSGDAPLRIIVAGKRAESITGWECDLELQDRATFWNERRCEKFQLLS